MPSSTTNREYTYEMGLRGCRRWLECRRDVSLETPPDMLVSSSLLLPLLSFAFLWTTVRAMTLCQYYDALGKYVPECHNPFHPLPGYDHNLVEEEVEPVRTFAVRPRPGPPTFVRFSSLSGLALGGVNPMELSEEPLDADDDDTMGMAVTTPTYATHAHNLCRGHFHSCFASDECESGTICTHTLSSHKCCTTPGSQCPTPTQLGFNCRKLNPTNWCLSDSDCNSVRTSRQMCCPTGCNYNVCLPERSVHLPTRMIADMYSTAKRMSPECPDPLSVPMKCEKVNPVSWCYAHTDCPSASSALNPRRCCLTPCGYNACFIRFGGVWVIG